MIPRLLAAFLLVPLWAAPVYAQTYTFTPQSSKDLTLTFQTEREGASRVLILARGRVVREGSMPGLLRERVLEVVLDAPPREPPPGFRVTVFGLETELGGGTVEAALALCRAHRLAVRASRVRLKSLEDVVLDALDDDTAR